MKFRYGYVSNSSSSSFILGYSQAPLDREGTVEFLKDSKNKNESLLVVGMEMGEGDDIFYLDSKRESFILDHEDRFLENRGDWEAYISPYKFDCEDCFNDYDSEENPDENSSGVRVCDRGTEKRVYKDYNSDSEDDFNAFIARYFLTSDEYETYIDYYWNETPPGIQGVILYKDKISNSAIPDDWKDAYIGINEFGGSLGVTMFSLKKLTDGDLKRLRSGKLKLKDGVCIYNELVPIKKKSKFVNIEGGEYKVMITDSFFDRVQSLKYFLKESEYEG